MQTLNIFRKTGALDEAWQAVQRLEKEVDDTLSPLETVLGQPDPSFRFVAELLGHIPPPWSKGAWYLLICYIMKLLSVAKERTHQWTANSQNSFLVCHGILQVLGSYLQIILIHVVYSKWFSVYNLYTCQAHSSNSPLATCGRPLLQLLQCNTLHCQERTHFLVGCNRGGCDHNISVGLPRIWLPKLSQWDRQVREISVMPTDCMRIGLGHDEDTMRTECRELG